MSYSLAEKVSPVSASRRVAREPLYCSGHPDKPAIVRAYYAGNRLAVCTGFFGRTNLFVERILELLIDFHLIPRNHLIRLVRHPYHRLQLVEHCVRHAFVPGRGRV